MPDNDKKNPKPPIKRNTDFDAKMLKSKAELPKGAVYAGKDENGQDTWEVRTKNENKDVKIYPKNPNPSVNKGKVLSPKPRDKKSETFGETIEKFTIHPPEVVPPKQTNLYSEVTTSADALPKNSANQDWTDYKFANNSGNTTNDAIIASFDNNGKHFTWDNNQNRVYSGKTIDDFRNNSIQQIETPMMSGVNKPNIIDNTNFSQKGTTFTKNANGGLGVNKSVLGTDLKGATDVYVPKQYDSLGKEIPSNNGLKPLGTSTDSKEVGKMYTIPGKFKKGGLVQKLWKGGPVDNSNFKISQNNYDPNNPISGQGIIAMGGQQPFTPTGNATTNTGATTAQVPNAQTNISPYDQAIANQKKQDKKDKFQANSKMVGGIAGQLGSGYYNSQVPESDGDAVYNKGMATVSQIGPVGGVIGGVAALGDAIGKPVRKDSEKIDNTTGKYKDKDKAIRNGSIGGALNPFKQLTTVLGDNDASTSTKINAVGSNFIPISGGSNIVMKDYYKDKEDANAKRYSNQIKQAQKENFNAKAQQAIANRDAGETNYRANDIYDLNNNKFDENGQLILKPTGYKKGGLVQRLSGGGEIKGKGGPKEDKINAKVEEGSFVVPAENSDLAKGIRKLYLKVPVKKANLNQKEGEEVKLSNGEHLFTPEENEYLESIGINLEALAPNAEKEEDGKKHGGLTSAKAKEILHDGTVHGKKITDQQRKFFGAIASGESIKMACGGMVKGYAEGGDVVDEIDPKKEREKIAAEEKAIKEAELNKSANKYLQEAKANKEKHRKFTQEVLTGSARKKAELEKEYEYVMSGKSGDYKGKDAQRERGKQLLDQIDQYNKKLKDVANEYNLSKDDKNYDLQGNFKPTQKSGASNTTPSKDLVWEDTKRDKQSNKTYEELIKPDAGYKGSKEDYKAFVDKQIKEGKLIPKESVAKTTIPTTTFKVPKVAVKTTPTVSVPQVADNGDNVVVPGSNLSPNEETKAKAEEQTNALNADRLNKSALATNSYGTTPNTKKSGSLADRLSNINIDPTIGVGIGQTVLGLNMLKGQTRPVDKAVIDPTYNANVDRAQRDAGYGLTAENKSLIEQDQQNALNDARFSARNFAGGNAGTAFNQERQAINSGLASKLGVRVADQDLRLQKQQYADQQVKDRAAMRDFYRRRAFEDAMGTFQQKQQAGSELIGAGLANSIDAYRFNKQMQERNKREGLDWSKNYNPSV